MTVEPKMSVGDKFYSKGQRWEVVHEPFLYNSGEGEQWWYPSRNGVVLNVKESLVDAPTEGGTMIDYDKHYALLRQWSGAITREEARTFLDAVLGDEPLYRRVKKFAPQMCGHRYDYVELWPKEEQ